MSLTCDNCSKGIQYGHAVSHARNRTKRVFKPNLHSARIKVGGQTKRLRLCTKCLRRLRTDFLPKEGATFPGQQG